MTGAGAGLRRPSPGTSHGPAHAARQAASAAASHTPSPAPRRALWRPARWPAITPVIAQAINLPIGLAVAALLLAAGLALVATPRWRAEQGSADQAARRLARAPRAAAPAAASATRDDQGLLAALPGADNAPRRVADLLALAAQRGVVVHSTRQALPAGNAAATGAWGGTASPSAATSAPATSSPAAAAWAVAPLRLAMGVQGSYSSLRRFVAEALQHDDALLLDQLRLARPSAQARELTADLQWTLLQREARQERPARADGSGPPAAAQPGRQR